MPWRSSLSMVRNNTEQQESQHRKRHHLSLPQNNPHQSVAARSAYAALSGATEKTPNKSPLMDKFQTPPKEATVRFTVDLPSSMHRKLSILAARTGKKKAEIVRVLLNAALDDIDQ
jgi:hypothetical protein